jgi:hypothetical protein
MRRRDNLRRRPAFRQPRLRILILCEGEVTEAEYFREKGRLHRSLVDVRVDSGGAPKTLVERAAQMKKTAAQAARRDPNEGYDEVWCVFDVDQHPYLAEAKQQAYDNGIQTAISNPCFELWILLHFGDQRAHINCADLARECRQHIPGYEKSAPLTKLMELEEDAVRRAIDLEKWQVSRGCEGHNPSTTVHHLTEQIRALGR